MTIIPSCPRMLGIWRKFAWGQHFRPNFLGRWFLGSFLLGDVNFESFFAWGFAWGGFAWGCEAGVLMSVRYINFSSFSANVSLFFPFLAKNG